MILSFIIFISILLLIFFLLALFFGYVWLKYETEPFSEVPYNISLDTAKLVTIISIILLILSLIVLSFAISSYTELDSISVKGNLIYKAPMYSEETRQQLIDSWSTIIGREEAIKKVNSILA